MYDLPIEQKRYLLRQNRESKLPPVSPSRSKSPSRPAYAGSYGPSSGANLLPRLVPQLTGDAGLMKRFSMSWSGNAAPPVVSPSDPNRSSGEFGTSPLSRGQSQVEEEMQPLQPQTTGGLWSSWWASSGGEKRNSGQGERVSKEVTAKWYVEGLRSGRTTDSKLVKHLISLRVHLSTAKLVWIQDFVGEEKGLDALGALLSGLVAKGGKHRTLSEIETSNLLEIIKCLRVLLNTEVR